MSEVFLQPDYLDVIAQWTAFFKLLKLADRSHVLDVGSHLGDAPRLLSRTHPEVTRVVGVEKNQRLYEGALRRNDSFPDIRNVEFHNCDGSQLPFPDESFEAAYCVDTIEWVDDKPRFINEIYRVLKPSGVFLLAHADFETQTILTDDPAFTRHVITAFTDDGKNGRIGRELPLLCRRSRFKEVTPGVYTIIDESFQEHTYAYYICNMMNEWVGKGGNQELVPKLANWIADLKKRDVEGAFFYSINKYWARCTKT
jgi:ubiquinone/menaquinone biosynthesis C-methylase UbiE